MSGRLIHRPHTETTGWRFVVEELEPIGAEVHLAEPAEAAALRGKKKRAKTDCADARHLRELLLIGRLPESWIPPTHILDLRARVRTRHLLSHQRTEWQQRIQAVLYHHRFPQRRGLLTLEQRRWLQALKLSSAARQQIEIALKMIDAVDIQLAPFDPHLRSYARKQTGCRALIDISVYQSDRRRAPGHISRQGPPALRWALYEAAQVARRGERSPRPRVLPTGERADRREPSLPISRAQGPEALPPHATRARRGGAPTGMTCPVRAEPLVTPMRRGQLPAFSCRHVRVDRPEKTERPQRFPQRDHPIKHHVAGPGPTRVADRGKAGRPRAQPPHHRPRARTTQPAAVQP